MKKAAIPAGLVLLVLALLVGALAIESGHHHPKGGTDKASDCWTHPDRLGHRHCAS